MNIAARAVTIPTWMIVLARVFLGCTFLFSDHGNGRGELAQFLKFATQQGFPVYRSFLATVVVPHAQLFGTIVEVAEIAVGIGLILGVATRAASVLAILLLINYESAKGSPPWTPGIDQSDIVIAMILFTGKAGLVCGVDGLIRERLRRRAAAAVP